MLPQEQKDPVPEHPFQERHETLSSIEHTPAKSFQDRMRRDPEFRFYIEEHQ